METIASGRVNERLSDDPTTRAIAWLTAWDTQGVRSGLIKYEGAERSVAYLPGTDGSNPFPSSGQSGLSQEVTRRGREARLFARVCGPWEVVRSPETGIGQRYGAYRRQCLCRVKFQYRSASDAVHDSRSSCRAKLVLAQSVKRSRAPSVARAR